MAFAVSFPNRIATFLAAIILPSSPLLAGELKLHHLRGMIGKAEIVEAFLAEHDQNITGNYYYKSKSRTIFVSGDFKQKGSNQFILTERTEGKHTGKFEGTILKGVWRGKWVSAGKPVREFKFELKPVPEKEIDFSYKILIRNILNERNSFCELHMDTFDVIDRSTSKPVDALAKILDADLTSQNQKSFCASQPKGQCHKDSLCALETENRVLLAANNMLSLEVSTFAYSGGAQGSSTHHFVNYDLLRKKELKLADLIEPAKWGEFQKRFEKRFKSYLKEIEVEESEFGKIPIVDDKTEFFMTPSSLFVFFEEGSIAAHAIGSIQLEFTRVSIDSLLKRDL